MASRDDDRRGPGDLGSTRHERGVPPVSDIHDEDSAAETEVFIAGVTKIPSATMGGPQRSPQTPSATMGRASPDVPDLAAPTAHRPPQGSITAVRETPQTPPGTMGARVPMGAAEKGLPAVTAITKVGGVAPAPPKARLGQTVSLVRAPLDEQGFGARYVPQNVLGEGGMGIVGLCKDVRIGRDVAMKMLRKEKIKSADAHMRFEREARVQGQLEHPAIVPVYDLGVRPDGTPFFTMKRLHGETLAEILDGLQKGNPAMAAAYPQRRLLSGLSRVALAIAFANSRGVLHRDLKPGNVMLGDFGEVYLLDWGLAKLTHAEEPDGAIKAPKNQKETQVGEVMGTPGYMSPEQLRGEIDQLDARTDVYTLGVLLFEILTLEPFHSRKGLDTIYNSTLGKLDARISQRALAKQVPPELLAVIVKATALEPADRYPSARELSDAIERFLEGNRDHRARSEMAAGHASTALEAAQLAATVPEMRELAIRELGAALALDPTHAGAMETLSRLMVDTSPEMSAEARREFARSRKTTYQESKRGVLASYALWMGFVPIVLALGVRDKLAAGITGGSVILAAVFSLIYATGRVGPWTRFAIYCAGTLAIASTCTLMGWAIVVPGLAAVHTVGFILYGDKRLQPAALALGALAVIVPFVLQEAGWLPRAYVFEGDRMIVLPRMTGLPAMRTQIYLLLSSLAAIVVPTVVISRLRDTLETAEERAFMHAWTLQNLMPGRAREAAVEMRKGATARKG